MASSSNIEIDLEPHYEHQAVINYITTFFVEINLNDIDYKNTSQKILSERIYPHLSSIDFRKWINDNTDEGTIDLLNSYPSELTITDIYQLILNASIVRLLQISIDFHKR